MHKRTVWLIAGGTMVVLGAIGAIFLGHTLLGPRAPEEAMDPPHFVEQAATTGIDHVYEGEWTFFVGGGVAVFDCDGDRQPDLFIAGGIEPAALYRNESPIGGELQFSKVPCWYWWPAATGPSRRRLTASSSTGCR